MEKTSFDLNQLFLENVTLGSSNMDHNVQPILLNVDFQVPVDQSVAIESSNPMHSLQFLQMLAGYKPCSSGRILWNGQDVFSDDHEFDPRTLMGVYFEGHFHSSEITIKKFFDSFLDPQQIQDVCELFELTPYLINDFTKSNYAVRKLLTLIQVISKQPQMLILEDPAQGLSEHQWLNLLDYIQLMQRKGSIRHIFMTNHHPTAMNHLEHNKLFVEDGVVYFDESVPVKKVAHF